MPSGRCRSCGGDLPADARFCPRCGTDLDEVPLLPLLGAQEAPTPTGADGEGPGASSGMRTVLVLVAGVVVLLLGLSAFAGGDDEPEDDAADQSDRADDERGRATRSTSTSRPSTTTMPGLLPHGGVPEAAGAVAIHASDDQLLVADLGTGRQIAVPGPGGPVQAILAHGAHLLVTAGGDT